MKLANGSVEPSTKRRKVNVFLIKGEDGLFSIDEEREALALADGTGEGNGDDPFSRSKIAEQTVEMAKSFQPTGFTLSSANV